MTSHRIFPSASPVLGAHYLSSYTPPGGELPVSGVQFAITSFHARRVELCLFDEDDNEQSIEIPWCQNHIWHLFVEGIKPGQRYGYRVHGPWNPRTGMRFNPSKLLVDPYAKKLDGQVKWCQALYDYKKGENGQWVYNCDDSRNFMPKSVVVHDDFDWGDNLRPKYSMAESVIYELNVRGFTMTHPEVPEHLRGTYLGLCQPAIIQYLKDLRITTIELLPITSYVSEERLSKQGMNNYWGYNPLAFMAPEAHLAVADPVRELKTMVKCLHEAGIEVIMDVVYNHTAEAGHDGPLLSYRGLDNTSYYLLDSRNPTITINHSGCGNTLKVEQPMVMKLVLDSLRHWVEEYHIDGFRFDLAPALGRRNWHFDRNSAFFQALNQDPVLSRVKLIAEPWDLAPDGYQLGNFPEPWSEWNDRYRDCIRAFWRGEHGLLGQVTERLCGSSDIYRGQGRQPSASVNYLCSHDGFTLNDMVSYLHKHNQANGENNRDGDNHNFSWNCGHEGETNNPAIRQLRERYKRTLLATLILSNGAVMFQAGDEFGNTQKGNNNVYCQDNETGWLDWFWLNGSSEQQQCNSRLQKFTAGLIRVRRSNARYQRDSFLRGLEEDPTNHEVLWRGQHGGLMQSEDWDDPTRQTLCLHWLGDQKEPCDCDFLILLNASDNRQEFLLPEPHARHRRHLVMDTASEEALKITPLDNSQIYAVEAHSLVVLQDYCQPCHPKGREEPCKLSALAG